MLKIKRIIGQINYAKSIYYILTKVTVALLLDYTAGYVVNSFIRHNATDFFVDSEMHCMRFTDFGRDKFQSLQSIYQQESQSQCTFYSIAPKVVKLKLPQPYIGLISFRI